MILAHLNGSIRRYTLRGEAKIQEQIELCLQLLASALSPKTELELQGRVYGRLDSDRVRFIPRTSR